jgi:hypothetical protein
MKKRIKYSVIGETASFLKQELEELRSARNQLLLDVNTINDEYKGKDATLIIEKYKEKITNIDNYIQAMDNFRIILDWLSGNYRDSHEKAKSNFEAFSSLNPIDDTDSNNKFSF